MRSLSFVFLFTGLSIASDPDSIRLVGKTEYLNHARAVVSHNIDDSTKYVPMALEAMDKYGIKATLFISTEQDPAPEDRFFTQLQGRDLWPRLRKAIDDGHEIGSHSRQHPCKRPDAEEWCSTAYTDYEVIGSRDDILKLTQQPWVWTWCYPCGNCANYSSIQKKIAAAGYIVARNYPNEAQDGHIRPDLQTWDSNPMNAGYTQVVQKRGGAAKSEIIDVANLNAKFDEIYQRGGIYNFMSHPQWLDYGPDGFYERHLAHISHRKDVWYVPMGPLYAYRTIREKTEIRQLSPGGAKARFSLSNNLDPKIYNVSITVDLIAPAGVTILSNGKILPDHGDALADRWDQEYFRREGDHVYVTVKANTTLELRSSNGAEVSGSWNLSYNAENGAMRQSKLDLKADGTQLTGTLVSDRGSARLEGGKVDGDTIAFNLERKGNGDDIIVHYQGRIVGNAMTLTMQYGNHPPVTMTGAKL